MRMVLAVAAGGALGALARYGLAGAIAGRLGTGFPWGTLTVNVLGCLVMGVLAESFVLAWSPGPAFRALLTVGFLGAFTTFSAFSLDAVALIQRGAPVLAGLYVAASVVLCLAALAAGLLLVRAVVL